MEQRITVVVTAPDGTNGITDAIAFALDNPMNYPDDVDTDDWCVYVPAENSKPEPETEILTMPPVPWINLPPDEHYAWNCALGRAIMLAHYDGVTTRLRGPDGGIVAEIGPPARGTQSAGGNQP